MDTKKEKDSSVVEIGNFYGIIGKDGREYKVEVLGKRVTEMDTDVYVHYEGTDKRLDEWVDMKRLMPLKIPLPAEGTLPEDAASGSDFTVTNSDGSQGSSVLLPDVAGEGSRPKRKFIKDEVQLLMESLKTPSRKKSGEISQDSTTRSSNSSANTHGHGHGHGHDHHDDEEVPRVRNVEWILYAGYDIATWYYSPFPEEYQDCQRLFICEYCLKYIRQVESFMSHTKSCKRKKPPGTVVYSKGVNKIYKVDGKTNKLYCQNLSLLAKLFLDNKTLYFDIHGFHFFVLTETRPGDRADVPVGFFSKEIVSYDGYNLACILILPPFQRKSYGKLLIEFSYELTKIEGKVGSPEKPLSDLGKLGYVSYWITAILRELYPKPWPAKRIVLPLATQRRKSRIASIKQDATTAAAAGAQPSVQGGNGIEVSSSSSSSIEPSGEGVALPDVRTQRNDAGPMDVDAPLPTEVEKTDVTKEIAFSIRELAAKTGIMEEDLLETLVGMGWMRHWVSPAEQAGSVAIKNAKRNYQKLVKFHEQQQLLESGVLQDGAVAGSSGGHEGESSTSAGVGGGGGTGLGHHYSKVHSRQPSGSNVSGSNNTSVQAIVSSAIAALQANDALAHAQLLQNQERRHLPGQQEQQQYLTQDVDPVSILEMVDSDGEDATVAGAEEESGMPSTTTATAAALTTDLMKDVAVVTLGTVKEYQDRHNIRLEPYVDWNLIDWVAYRRTLD